MAFNIVFEQSVQNDIDQALKYYDEISTELSLRFEIELFVAIDKLKVFPFNYFNLTKGLRRITLKSFPFMIIIRLPEKKY